MCDGGSRSLVPYDQGQQAIDSGAIFDSIQHKEAGLVRFGKI
jgi:hypothetical protein